MNLGLTELLTKSFTPGVFANIKDFHLLSGFVTGEGVSR